MRALSIIGASGHGKVVADVALTNGYEAIRFLDDAWQEIGKLGNWPVAELKRPITDKVFCAVGRNATRERLFNTFCDNNSPTLIHPAAVISRSARIGAGTIAVAGAIVNADAVIGRGVILNTACSVDHDCYIEEFAHVSPGVHLAGDVHVGRLSWIGIGAVVKEGVKIGRNATIAAGAVVIKDIPDGTRVAGVPARKV